MTDKHRDFVATATDETAADDTFLDRWSRRKRATSAGAELPQEPDEDQSGGADVQADARAEERPVRIDERTGKPYDELTDEDMPSLDALDQDSDVSMFMARNISPSLRMKALNRIFHSPKYNKVCLCAEYADDYTNFLPMGDIVPHDLKSAIAREAARLRDRLKERGLEISEEDARVRVAAEARGESLPDIESLAEDTARREVEQAQAEKPDNLHG